MLSTEDEYEIIVLLQKFGLSLLHKTILFALMTENGSHCSVIAIKEASCIIKA